MVDSPPGMTSASTSARSASLADLDRLRPELSQYVAVGGERTLQCEHAHLHLVASATSTAPDDLPAALGELDVELVDLLARHRLAEASAHLGEDVRIAEVRGRLDDRLRPHRRVRRS